MEKEQIEPIEDEQEEILIDHYEICFLISGNFTTEEVVPIKDKVVSLIKENGGKITLEDDLGKQKLAYPIKNLSHGYYLLLEFDMPKEKLQELNTALKLTNKVTRFLIVKKKIKTKEELKKEVALQEKLTKRKEEAIDKIKEEKKESQEKPKKEEKVGKVSLEDLDKKLDEILDSDEIM